jgi:hypothetical protein
MNVWAALAASLRPIHVEVCKTQYRITAAALGRT